MREDHREDIESKKIFYAELEEFAREKVRQYLQELLEAEVAEWSAVQSNSLGKLRW